jgi:hypothetical protein
MHVGWWLSRVLSTQQGLPDCPQLSWLQQLCDLELGLVNHILTEQESAPSN